MPTLVDGRPHGTRLEFSRHIGKSPAYVTKLGHQGRLVERMVDGKKLVDFDLSVRLIRNTEDMGRARNGQNARAGQAAAAAAATQTATATAYATPPDDEHDAEDPQPNPYANPPRGASTAGPPPPGVGTDATGIVGGFADNHRTDRLYRQAQAQQRVYEAKLAELTYRERIGKLVLVDDVRAEHARLLAMIRETFQQLPLRVVPLLAAEPDAAAMDAVLRREIASALHSIAHTD